MCGTAAYTVPQPHGRAVRVAHPGKRRTTQLGGNPLGAVAFSDGEDVDLCRRLRRIDLAGDVTDDCAGVLGDKGEAPLRRIRNCARVIPVVLCQPAVLGKEHSVANGRPEGALPEGL